MSSYPEGGAAARFQPIAALFMPEGAAFYPTEVIAIIKSGAGGKEDSRVLMVWRYGPNYGIAAIIVRCRRSRMKRCGATLILSPWNSDLSLENTHYFK